MLRINKAGYQLYCGVQLGMERCDPQEVKESTGHHSSVGLSYNDRELAAHFH